MFDGERKEAVVFGVVQRVRFARRTGDDETLRAVVDRPTLLGMQRAIESVHVSEPVGRYVVSLVAATRDSDGVQVGSSPRGSLALMKLARVRAALQGRSFVTPDDVKLVAVPGLGHRMTLPKTPGRVDAIWCGTLLVPTLLFSHI